MRLLAACILVLLSTVGGASGKEAFKYPPPDLGPDYVAPHTSMPEITHEIPPIVDVGILVIALTLASYLALKKRCRTGIWLLCAASLVYFGFYRQGCVCPIGAIQSVAEAIFSPTAVISLAVIAFFILPLMFTLFFGRTFCAAVCPLGAMQEVVLIRPLRLPAWLCHALGLLPVVYLALAVLFAATGSAYVICRYDPFIALFRLNGPAGMLVLGACFLVISLFVGRPYCRFLCPYGLLLGWASKLSWRRITITPDECIKCHLCENSCPYGAITTPNEDTLPEDRRRGTVALLCMLLAAPLVIAASTWIMVYIAPSMAKMHPTVRLAERIKREDDKEVSDSTDASQAFRESGRSSEELLAEAADIRDNVAQGSGWAGAFIGLMIALRLISLATRRTREDYQADRTSCVACGRCYEFCPVDPRNRAPLDGGGG
ncbi:MAG: 4Fe-4S binding protein [Phycisphaerae bacterium]|nr:4Fe-4S binding protein [Phycisphaerae bacterium]